MDKNYEIVEFKNGEFKLDVSVTPNSDTVWLNVNQMSKLFNKNKSTILRHIKNILAEELDDREVVAKFATTFSHGSVKGKTQIHDVTYYNLDVIISVGYRVKSKEGIIFRKWANNILKQYLLKGYVINEKKFNIPSIENITSLLEKSRKTTGSLQLKGDDMLDFLLAYNKGLSILDDFDHQTMEVECSLDTIYILNYEECIQLIHETSFYNEKNLFALEKNDSFKSAIETIYQTFDGKDLYPTLEDKAVNLLYLITKNHAFADGNKRIAATIFLYFLEKNNALFKNEKPRISNTTLATLTILVASSNPEDKESIINLIKLILFK